MELAALGPEICGINSRLVLYLSGLKNRTSLYNIPSQQRLFTNYSMNIPSI